ncbi:MAG: cell division protein ZapA [Ghiorsea sp.]
MSVSVEIAIAGQKLNINTDDDPKQVLAAASLVQEQFEKLKSSGAIIDSSKIMTLIALNLADELLNKKTGNPEMMLNLISSLDHAVSQAEGLASVSLR